MKLIYLLPLFLIGLISPVFADEYIVIYDDKAGQQAATIYGEDITPFQTIPGYILQSDFPLTPGKYNGYSIFIPTQVHVSLDFSVPLIQASQIHAGGNTGQGVTICVLDTGIYDEHPSIPTPIAEFDFVNNDNDAHDGHGHGTHVAGTALGRDAQFRGVAPDA